MCPCRLTLPPQLSGPLHMRILLPRVPSLTFLDWANYYLDFKPMLSFPTHTHQPGPGGGVGPAGAAGPRCQRQGCKLSSCETRVLATARNDSRGVERQEGLGVTLYHKPESHAKVPGIRTGRFGPDLPLSSGLGPRGSPSTSLGEIREAQTPESAVRTTGQVLHLVSAPID